MFVCTERERDEVNFDFQIKACPYISTHLMNQKQETTERGTAEQKTGLA
jgi:hypothetical protein